MNQIRVKITPTTNIARVQGFIIVRREKKKDASKESRRIVVHDFDIGRLDPVSNKWILLLRKATGNRVIRNYLQVEVYDQRGRKIDSLTKVV